LKLDLKITFQSEQFVDRITNVEKVENSGYNVQFDEKQLLQLRKNSDGWYAVLPTAMRKQFKQVQPYFLAGQLKRSILTYRLLEAGLAKLTNDQLESKVSEDIAPIFFAIFPKEEYPKLFQWVVKDVEEVITFYSQFENIEQMKAHIIETHKLKNDS
jgi:hypothetical protein